jgi:hypothetical protein
MYASYLRFIVSFVIICLMIFSSIFYPTGVAIKSDIALNSMVNMLGGMFVVVLLVERATEVIIVIWRDEGAGVLQQSIDESDDLENEDLSKSNKLRAFLNYKETTKRIAIIISFLIAIIVSSAGVGLLGSIVDNQGGNKFLLRLIDIFLTSGLIAGGSQGFHLFTSAIGVFFIESKKRLSNSP